MRVRVLRVAAAVALVVAACHQPEEPPASPPLAPLPNPNPTTGRIHGTRTVRRAAKWRRPALAELLADGTRVAFDRDETIDASIESDGASVDARVFQLDTGASR